MTDAQPTPQARPTGPVSLDCAVRLQRIERGLTLEIHKLGFPPGAIVMPCHAEAVWDTVRDPYSQTLNPRAILRGKNGAKLGQVQFNSDGGFYAEFDVVKPHPKDSRWFVEAVAAWGRDDSFTSEAKLLPAL